MHKFPYKWNISDGYPAKNIDNHGLKVFGTFVCGGGSTMGYKLAGFEHLGGVEIDPKISNVYVENHKPKYMFTEDIRNFVKRNDIPDELYSLDILDGSPPCSSFSMAGNREKDWGKEKVFKEGQAKQRLDDLFFDFIALTKKLKPKVVIAENVKGMLSGNAKSYVRKIKQGFEEAGYKVQLFLLNAASMGVPQKRERVFFVCQRNDLNFPKLDLQFNEDIIPLKNYIEILDHNDLTEIQYQLWKKQKQNDRTLADVRNKPNGFTDYLISENEVVPTITSGGKFLLKTHPRWLSKNEFCQAGSYPLDYNFKAIDAKYLIGMSVPPVMTAQIAHQIYLQWFKTSIKELEKIGK
jgi:DNA (cytosine-5)-methyltransferase 1